MLNKYLRSSIFDFRSSIFDLLSSILDLQSSTANSLKYLIILFIFVWAVITGCRQDMHDQPRFEPLEKNNFYADGRSSRPVIAGTVARGQLNIDDHFYKGKVNGELVATFPFPITKEVLSRGRERFNIFCTPCHGALGYGNGMIVQRGFRPPPSFHIQRLREAPVGHFFDVMTNGLGAMYDYRDKVAPADRWAITAYIRTLQFSQNAAIEDVPEEMRQKLIEE
jgi:hypothetical protein